MSTRTFVPRKTPGANAVGQRIYYAPNPAVWNLSWLVIDYMRLFTFKRVKHQLWLVKLLRCVEPQIAPVNPLGAIRSA